MLVTPRIVRDAVDVQRLTDQSMEEFEQANIDVFFERGLLKLQEKKKYLRNEFRPSEEGTEAYRKGGRYQSPR